MKTLFGAVMISSMVGFSLPVQAAPPVELLNVAMQTSAFVRPAIIVTDPIAVAATGAPISLLSPQVICGESESAKVCAVRRAAARRAVEVVTDEVLPRHNVQPMSLLIPVGLTPVRAVACDPQMTVEECNRLNGRAPTAPIVPPGPLPVPTPVPPVTPIPPAPDLGRIPPVVTVPGAPPPVIADPEAIIKPPPTGDAEIVKKPPPTDSDMPVIKPKVVVP